MTISQQLHAFKKDLDHALALYMKDAVSRARSEDVFVAHALAYFTKTLLAGGKRIRPFMMCQGYYAAGGHKKKAIVKASMSIELIHAFLLMHDDIVDRDDVRHGVKTLHAHYRSYATRLFRTQDAQHFGMSTGLIMGDLIYALGNNALFSADFPPARIVRAVQKTQAVVWRTALGEMQDIVMEHRSRVREADIITMYRNKTARYTFEGPFQLGALLGGASDAAVENMSAFAVPLGIAFQLQDDLLGIFGSTKKTGKPVGSDVAEGKKTVLVVRAVSAANRTDTKTLTRLLGKQDITRAEIRVFQNILTETGARASVEEDIRRYCDEAQELLEKASLPKHVLTTLLGLVDHLRAREY